MKKPVAVNRTYKPRKTRSEWLEILKDMEDNNLSMKQVMTMYNVSEGSIYQWISNFKKEFEVMPKTESHVTDLIQKSISDLKIEKGINLDNLGDLQTRNLEIDNTISRLEKSLEVLQVNENIIS